MFKQEEYNEKIIEYFNQLDRAFFIDNEYSKLAHYDRPLPIGYEQTISQPSLVLEMTLQLELNKKHKVLEIGTGSGYQTALLAQFSDEVFTIERIAELSQTAFHKLTTMGFRNIRFKIGDGSEGWKEFSPFDRIIITAAASRIPAELTNQLDLNGKMIVPVGEKDRQKLIVIQKDNNGRVKKESLGIVKFVEFKGKYGW